MSTPNELARMMVQYEQRLARLEAAAQVGQLNNASITGRAIKVYDEDGETLRQVIGLHGDGTAGTTAMNGPVPPQPTVPTLVPGQLSLTVSWDGAFVDADGDPMPRPTDLRHVEVHTSTSSGFTPNAGTLQGTLAQAGSLVVQPLEVSLHYVRLVAVSTSSVSSTPSTQASATPEQVVATDVLDGIITTLKLANDAVTNAKIAGNAVDANKLADGSVDAAKLTSGLASDISTAVSNAASAISAAASAVDTAGDALTAAQAAQATADGAIRTWYQATAPGGLNDTTDLGDLWFDTDSNQAYRWNGTTWVLIQDNAIAEALAAAQDAQTTADGKIVSYFQSGAPTGAATGDLWYDTANGNRVSWWDGDSWEPVQMGTAAIQADAITADLISAGAVGTNELAANSVVAGKVAAGEISATHLASQAVTTAKLDALAVTADKVAANAITAGKIEAGAVTAEKLEADLALLGAIRSPDFSAGSSGWSVNADGVEFNNGVFRGELVANSITGTSIGSSSFAGGTILASTVTQPDIVMDPDGGRMLVYSLATTTQTFTASGTFNVPGGVTSLKVECWGAGGGGRYSSGAGGGGGEYAAEYTLTVTPSESLTVTVGTGGAGGNSGSFSGGDGGASSVKRGGTTLVVANGGKGATTALATQGGTGSSNSVHFNGGSSSAATRSTIYGGAGGGGSAGTASAGNPGPITTGASGTAGGAAVSGGGAGGAGGHAGIGPDSPGNGVAGSAPGGGGGTGGGNGGIGAAGARGQVRVTYTASRTLILSIAPASGTDSYGNPYPAGVGLFGASPVLQWGAAGGSVDTDLYRRAAGVLATTSELWVEQGSAATGAFLAQVVGDNTPRLNILTDGKIEWGSGSATRDTNLYRSAANTLKTDDSLEVGNVFRSASHHYGTVTISPVLNTATSVAVTGLDVAGSTFYGFVTPNSGAPGDYTTPTTANTVKMFSISGVSSTGCTVWIYRGGTTNTIMYYQVIGQ